MFVCVSDKTDENGAVVGIAWDSSYLKTILGRLTLGAIVSLHKYSKIYLYIRVIHHFFQQSQNKTAVLNVFQDLKSEISEKSDQN